MNNDERNAYETALAIGEREVNKLREQLKAESELADLGALLANMCPGDVIGYSELGISYYFGNILEDDERIEADTLTELAEKVNAYTEKCRKERTTNEHS
jgi:hypothetical protein